MFLLHCHFFLDFQVVMEYYIKAMLSSRLLSIEVYLVKHFPTKGNFNSQKVLWNLSLLLASALPRASL